MTMIFHSGTATQGKFTISSNGSLGIGTSSPQTPIWHYNEWQEILELSETNPAVKIALDRLRTTVHLSKDYGNSET